MMFFWIILLLLLAQGSPLLIESCDDLKMAIEGAAAASSALVLQLRSNGRYHCKESIHVAAAQSVIITGGGAGPSEIFVSSLGLSRTAARPSLFVNEGSLKLLNISVELHTARDEAVRGVGGSGRRSRRQEEGQQPACVGVGLVWNSGHAVVEDSHVFESGPSVFQRCHEEGPQQARVVSVRGENNGKGPHGAVGYARS